jgi:putative ATPase
MPPRTILNAPTKLMRQEGYGSGYRYDHDEPDAFSGQDYWPEKLGRQSFYEPTGRGFERTIGDRLQHWEHLREQRASGSLPSSRVSAHRARDPGSSGE